jgi:ATP-dependent Clp endopeptidase proteolytic subunit ClpP
MNFAEPKETTEDKESVDILSMLGTDNRQELRLVGIYGEVSEEKCAEAVYGLYALHQTGQGEVLTDPEDENSERVKVYEPIDFVISTTGGLAVEMFSVYDVVRELRSETPVHTKGIGKVMSAGVLLLASGEKGRRKIGRYCRVMIHGVVAGTHGHIADVENEFAETKYTQKMYIKALAEETDMTEKYIKKLMDKKTNIYLDAEEAVNLGIADIII